MEKSTIPMNLSSAVSVRRNREKNLPHNSMNGWYPRFDEWVKRIWVQNHLPSGKRLQFAIENGHRNSVFTWIYPLKIVIFHHFLYVYQRLRCQGPAHQNNPGAWSTPWIPARFLPKTMPMDPMKSLFTNLIIPSGYVKIAIEHGDL